MTPYTLDIYTQPDARLTEQALVTPQERL